MTCCDKPEKGDIVTIRAKITDIGDRPNYGPAFIHVQPIAIDNRATQFFWISPNDIVAIEKRPLQVGDKVVSDIWLKGWEGVIHAIVGDEAWIKSRNPERGQDSQNIYKLDKLRRV